MKKLFVLLIAIAAFALPYTVQSQNQRLLMVERFTNASCGPCAAYGPAFTALLEANADKLVSLEYHWYYPGNDPMHNQNPDDPNGRMTYYNGNYVPFFVLSGNYYSGNIANLTQQMINTYSTEPTPVEMRMGHYLSADQDSIYVTLLVRSNEVLSGNIRGHIAVIEKEIHFATAPGSNGEKDFYNVMKALLPGRSGTGISNLNAGDYVVIQAGWKLANVYDIAQLSALGFVQNNDNKHIYQAVYSTEGTVEAYYNNDASITAIKNIPSFNCNGIVTPVVTLSNYGASTMTNAVIEVSINGEVVHTTNWNGNLSSFRSTDVELGDIEFDLIDENEIVVTVLTPNETNDEYIANDSFTDTFDKAASLNGQNVSVVIRTNNAPEETTWEIRHSNGDLFATGGPYDQANHMYNIPLELSELDCYQFTIFDENGLMTDGNGFYVLAIGNNTIFQGADFAGSETNYFAYGYVDVNENNLTDNVNIYPNPTSKKFNLELFLNQASNVTVAIYDITGRTLYSENLGYFTNGSHSLNNWSGLLNKGVYFVNITTDSQNFTKKLVIE